MVDFIEKPHYGYEDLLKLVTFLRSEEGCSWDHAQTHTSIRRNFLEEAYEAVEGLDLDDPAIMREEFGDVLLQVVFHADIERQRGRFSMEDVCDGICRKLIRRHPHLFSGGAPQDWDELKKREKGAKTQSQLMDQVARALPALIRSEKLLEKAAAAPAKAPKQEDPRLLADRFADAPAGTPEAEALLGRLLFQAVRLGVEKGCDPETALQNTCEDFIRQFAAAEAAEKHPGECSG